MCQITRIKSPMFPTIQQALKKALKKAGRNITVYKVVSKSRRKGYYTSIARGFSYKEGYHYYLTGRKHGFIDAVSFGKEIRFYYGLHSLTKMPTINDRASTVIKCIIPKDSLYAEGVILGGFTESIVSNHLIIVGEVTDLDRAEYKKRRPKRKK